MKLRQISPEFVSEIPRELEPGKLYICCRYRAVSHLCACGCGTKINTPLHPTGWSILFDGISVSLWPSIGNWSEACESHYWITSNEVKWSIPWTRKQILEGRRKRDLELDQYFSKKVEIHDQDKASSYFVRTKVIWKRVKQRIEKFLRGNL